MGQEREKRPAVTVRFRNGQARYCSRHMPLTAPQSTSVVSDVADGSEAQRREHLRSGVVRQPGTGFACSQSARLGRHEVSTTPLNRPDAAAEGARLAAGLLGEKQRPKAVGLQMTAAGAPLNEDSRPGPVARCEGAATRARGTCVGLSQGCLLTW